MSVLIITGPAGAGKNTVAKIFANKRSRCAVIDVDVVRHMLMQPHLAPWAGEEGKRQQILAVENVCALTMNFVEEECDVIILDVLSAETLKLYKQLLEEYKPKVVLLLPSYEETQTRNASRPKMITDEEVFILYKSQEALSGYDEKIDTTKLSAEETAERLGSIMF